MSGSDLTISFAAIASYESSLGSSSSSDDGRSKSDVRTELVVMFWWLCCRCAVRIAAAVNTVGRGGAALACVVMEMMCWFDAAVEYAVQCVWAGCGLASRKWYSVSSFVASGLCGSAVAIASTASSRMVVVTVCGTVSAVQGLRMSANVNAGTRQDVQCPRMNVAAETGQEREPDTIVSGNVGLSEPDTCVSGCENVKLVETGAAVETCCAMVDADLGGVVRPCVGVSSGSVELECRCTVVQKLLGAAELAIHHAVNECECGAYEGILPVADYLSAGVLGVDSLCGMVQAMYGVELKCQCKYALEALDVAQMAMQGLANQMGSESMKQQTAMDVVVQQSMVTAAVAMDEVVHQSMVTAAAVGAEVQQPMGAAASENEVRQQPMVAAALSVDGVRQQPMVAAAVEDEVRQQPMVEQSIVKAATATNGKAVEQSIVKAAIAANGKAVEQSIVKAATATNGKAVEQSIVKEAAANGKVVEHSIVKAAVATSGKAVERSIVKEAAAAAANGKAVEQSIVQAAATTNGKAVEHSIVKAAVATSGKAVEQ